MGNVNIEVHHVTRVEGHGNIVVNAKNGVLEECRLDIVETPRFFEAMLRGRPYTQSSHITSRICGICAVGHATASLRATENALGIEPSEQTVLLRKLNFHGEMLDSHVLHVYMLVAPDMLGVGSVIPLVQIAPEAVLRALRLKKLAGDLCAVISGRHTHPIAMAVGGFTHFPTIAELKALRVRLVDARVDMDETVKLAKTLPWPQFNRETEYVALRKEDEYAFIDGTITTTDGGKLRDQRLPPGDQRAHGDALDGEARGPQAGIVHGRRAGSLQRQPRQAASARESRGRRAWSQADLHEPVSQHGRAGGRAGALRRRCHRHHRRVGWPWRQA